MQLRGALAAGGLLDPFDETPADADSVTLRVYEDAEADVRLVFGSVVPGQCRSAYDGAIHFRDEHFPLTGELGDLFGRKTAHKILYHAGGIVPGVHFAQSPADDGREVGRIAVPKMSDLDTQLIHPAR